VPNRFHLKTTFILTLSLSLLTFSLSTLSHSLKLLTPYRSLPLSLSLLTLLIYPPLSLSLLTLYVTHSLSLSLSLSILHLFAVLCNNDGCQNPMWCTNNVEGEKSVIRKAVRKKSRCKFHRPKRIGTAVLRSLGAQGKTKMWGPYKSNLIWPLF
jgi:hypothetical protein